MDVIKKLMRVHKEKSCCDLLSGTGNTEMMAKAIVEGAKEGVNEVKLLSVDQASLDDVKNAECVALGCPSMEAEVLEEAEMEPYVESLQSVITGKNVVLFGSYDWGNGQWMEDWEKRMEDYGANLVDKGTILHLTPDDQNHFCPQAPNFSYGDRALFFCLF